MTNTILNRRGVPAGLFVSDPRTAEAACREACRKRH